MSNQRHEERGDRAQEERDDRALELRVKKRSFAAIARIVGYDHVSEAQAGFNRALRRRTPKEQASIREAELGRLDDMAQRVRDNKELTADAVARKLKAVERLRTLLLAP